MPIFHADGVSGTVAVHTGNNDDPFFDPLDHLDVLKFHSDLDYIKVIDEVDVTLSLPARTGAYNSSWGYTCSQATWNVTHTLFSHGRPGQPLIFGAGTIGGVARGFNGSLPVQQGLYRNNTIAPWVRWVTIGADNTAVRAFEYLVVGTFYRESGNWSLIRFPAISIPIRTWVTDELF